MMNRDILTRQYEPEGAIEGAREIFQVRLLGKSYLVGTNARRALMIESDAVESTDSAQEQGGDATAHESRAYTEVLSAKTNSARMAEKSMERAFAENVETLLRVAEQGWKSGVRIHVVKRWAGAARWPALQACPACDGRGTRECYGCGGVGTQSDSEPSGTGERLTCESCEGKRTMQCPTCRGTGTRMARPDARTGVIGASLIDRNLVAQLLHDVTDEEAVLVRAPRPYQGTLFLGKNWIGIVMPMVNGKWLTEVPARLEDEPGVFVEAHGAVQAA